MYLFIIYSCVKNLNKANDLYNLISHRLQDCECYIMCGVPTLNGLYQIVDKYLYINCQDGYENLCEKTMTLCKTIKYAFPNANGVFKCDDDIIPNVSTINKIIQFISEHNSHIHYLGKRITIPKTTYDMNYYNKIGKSIMKTALKYKLVKCQYCAGPLYYLSMKSVDKINSSVVDFTQIVSEDNMVGVILTEHSIFPYNLDTYSDHFRYGIKSMHNKNNLPKIYVLLHGGLGNQMFQVSAGYELAKKHKMIPILLYKKEYQVSLAHNKSEHEFMKTIFSYFNYTYLENIDCDKLTVYNEPRSFNYEPNVVTQQTDYLINGYFQNKNYILDDKDIIFIFKNAEMCCELLVQYPLLNNSYFIHVRVGDYVKSPDLYHFDKESYYKQSIDYILSMDDNPHFYILSDDDSFCREFELFKHINKTIIDVDELNTLNALYFMSLCNKGGICANSTFSGWASKLNANVAKIIICPKQWINVGYDYEIPFNYTISF